MLKITCYTCDKSINFDLIFGTTLNYCIDFAGYRSKHEDRVSQGRRSGLVSSIPRQQCETVYMGMG